MRNTITAAILVLFAAPGWSSGEPPASFEGDMTQVKARLREVRTAQSQERASTSAREIESAASELVRLEDETGRQSGSLGYMLRNIAEARRDGWPAPDYSSSLTGAAQGVRIVAEDIEAIKDRVRGLARGARPNQDLVPPAKKLLERARKLESEAASLRYLASRLMAEIFSRASSA